MENLNKWRLQIAAIPPELTADADRRWEEFQTAAGKDGSSVAFDNGLIRELKGVFALSAFAARTCTRRPESLFSLIDKDDLYQTYAADAYMSRVMEASAEVADDTALSVSLRRFRAREMLRLVFRDLTGKADLFEIMRDLSNLAEACIQRAFSVLYDWQCAREGVPCDEHGKPQSIVVLGMGKLGAGELNFSSDVDLMFAYPESGATRHETNPVSNETFFTRLCRRFMSIFSGTSAEGPLFRVDLRLRPFGENGPLVMSFDATEDYYQNQGREWERYALIKARCVAGDKSAGQTLLKRLQPFVYRRYLDYGTFESLRQMKQSIALEVKRRGMVGNIKLGAGGIREIEFFGQVFQLIRGGVEPRLKEASIVKVLRTLAEAGYIDSKICDGLTEAYLFLRTVEHRLQEYDDQQTHTLPVDGPGRARLAAGMGFADWPAFKTVLNEHLECVHGHFMEILEVDSGNENQSNEEKKLEAVWLELKDPEAAHSILLDMGYARPDEIAGLLNTLRGDSETRLLSEEGRKRVDQLMPLILAKVARADQPELVFRRIVDLIKAIERRSCYIALLLEHPETISQLITLAQASPWIMSFLTRHPVLLDELLDPRTLFRPPSREELAKELNQRFHQAPQEDLEYQIEELCIFKQVNTLRVAAADINAAYPLMRVSDHLSDIAELVMKEIMDISWRHLQQKHGLPTAVLDGEPCETGFAVIAYGKLGGIELGYGSDLDLVFLHAASAGLTSGTETPTENTQFYARLGQRILHVLTAHTQAGVLYEIDMRLRPSGSSGVLVVHVDAFGEYQHKDAWTWEHQALTRARFICGDDIIARKFLDLRKTILMRSRDPNTLRSEIRGMREKMRGSSRRGGPDQFDLKQGRGGIVDIEFLVQYLILQHAHTHEALVDWSDNIRQLETLAKVGVLETETAEALKKAYLALRRRVHRSSLQEKAALIPFSEMQTERETVMDMWNRFLGDTLA